MTPEDTACALAAEIDWLDSYFSSYSHEYLKYQLDSSNRNNLLKIYRRIRNVGVDNLFAPISSGMWKYMSYRQGDAWEVIDRISRELSTSREQIYSYIADDWNILWNEIQRAVIKPDASGENLGSLINNEGEWLIKMMEQHMGVQTAFLAAAMSQNYSENMRKAIDSHFEHIESKRASWIKLGIKTTINPDELKSSLLDGTLNIEELRLKSINAMEKQLANGKDILKRAELTVSAYGRLYTLFNYEHILAIEWDCAVAHRSTIHDRIEKIIGETISLYISSHSGQVSALRIVPEEYHEFEGVILVAAYRFPELQALFRMSAYLTTALFTQAQVRTTIIFNMQQPYCLFGRKETTEFEATLFWEILGNALSVINNRAFKSELVSVSRYELLKDIGLSKSVKEDLRSAFSSYQQEIEIPLSEGEAYMTGEIFKAHDLLAEFKNNNGVDIGIVTVVSDEMSAVHDHMIGHPGYSKEAVYGKKSRRDFYLGSLPAKEGHHSVACIQCLGQGEVEASYAITALRDEFNPRLYVLTGIAAAISDDLDFCDVCVADSVIDYDSRAECESGPKRTFIPLAPMPAWLRQLQKRLEKSVGEKIVLPAYANSKNREFTVRTGPLGTGKAVIKNRGSEIIGWLKDLSRKMLDIDTEAVAIAKASDLFGLQDDIRFRGYLIVRGISDMADKDKDKKFRYVPVRNAMIYLEELLKHASKGFQEEVK